VPNGDISKFPQLASLLQPTTEKQKKKKKKKEKNAPPPAFWDVNEIPNMVTSALARSPDIGTRVIKYMLVSHFGNLIISFFRHAPRLNLLKMLEKNCHLFLFVTKFFGYS
jgi:hypothetical protein